MSQWYSLIMESDRNPLRNLPPAQRFQLMVFFKCYVDNNFHSFNDPLGMVRGINDWSFIVSAWYLDHGFYVSLGKYSDG